MLVHNLHLRDFRNINRIDLTLCPGINVIHGLNAQGKTNMLEAIYLLVTGRSFRTTNESELAPWNAPDYQGTLIKATVSKKAGLDELSYYLNGRHKRIAINGTPISRLTHLIGRLNAVLFTPTDLLLVRGAPALRRRFLDIAIGQTNPAYLDALQTYQHVLKNRNILLKQASSGRDLEQQLDVYDEQLAAAGVLITEVRQKAVLDISESAARHYAIIANSAEPLSLNYQPDISISESDNPIETIRTTLVNARREDLRRYMTSRGVHRDDFQFIIQKFPARHFASQGQQRTAVLAAKLAEMDYLKAQTDESPVLMLDDLMSELDEHRKSALLNHLDPATQTFITTTDPSTIARYAKINGQFHVSNGAISLSLPTATQ